jgi:hypothetical protein
MGKPTERPDARLLAAIKTSLPDLEALRDQVNDHWGYEDGVYRFYHQSFKVYALQALTLRIVALLRGLTPERALNPWFEEIVAQGTGKTFQLEHNTRWTAETRPIVEALFHAKFFIDMVCKYGRELEDAPQVLPSGWAAVLYLYGMR